MILAPEAFIKILTPEAYFTIFAPSCNYYIFHQLFRCLCDLYFCGRAVENRMMLKGNPLKDLNIIYLYAYMYTYI